MKKIRCRGCLKVLKVSDAEFARTHVCPTEGCGRLLIPQNRRTRHVATEDRPHWEADERENGTPRISYHVPTPPARQESGVSVGDILVGFLETAGDFLNRVGLSSVHNVVVTAFTIGGILLVAGLFWSQIVIPQSKLEAAKEIAKEKLAPAEIARVLELDVESGTRHFKIPGAIGEAEVEETDAMLLKPPAGYEAVTPGARVKCDESGRPEKPIALLLRIQHGVRTWGLVDRAGGIRFRDLTTGGELVPEDDNELAAKR